MTWPSLLVAQLTSVSELRGLGELQSPHTCSLLFLAAQHYVFCSNLISLLNVRLRGVHAPLAPFVSLPGERASQVALVVRNSPAHAGDLRDPVRSLSQEDPWRRTWQPTPVFLPGESSWTEEPGGLRPIGSQSWTRLKPLSTHASIVRTVVPSSAHCECLWLQLTSPQARGPCLSSGCSNRIP